ncbi:hypothetical protein ACNO5E_15845 [Vibrio parahaemolyticus]|uniref:hypothetical protein n=1 Tax=Vibrio parahaemolyticus TaxID=670 RepID=UPI000812E9F1|nr:hypothetical protein [Vibrio parahaemolyticus]OCP68327.1 hypothetical protein AKH08_16055 [Vibrio parahaemolyticus]
MNQLTENKVSIQSQSAITIITADELLALLEVFTCHELTSEQREIAKSSLVTMKQSQMALSIDSIVKYFAKHDSLMAFASTIEGYKEKSTDD